jgi:hypothetical protein
VLALAERAPTVSQKSSVVMHRDSCRTPWVWDGLCFAVPMHEASANGLRDVVTNTPASTTGGTWVRDNKGNPTLQLTAATQWVGWPAGIPQHCSPTTAITAMVRFKEVAAGDGNGDLFSMGHTLGGNYGQPPPPVESWSISLNVFASGPAVGWVATSAAPSSGADDLIGSTLVNISTTEYQSAFMRWQSGAAATLDLVGETGKWVDSSAGSGAWNGSIVYNTSTPQGLRINATPDTTVNADGLYSQAMLWNRRLSDNEIRALSTDPFGWYAPRRENVGLSPFLLVPGDAGSAGYAGDASPPMF